MATGLSPALAQPLLCPPVAAAAGRPCELFHFHVQLFRPESRDFIELYGINQFASMASCDRARDAQLKRNMSIVEFMHTQRRDWWQADKFGPCHCDMTVEKGSPNVLSDAARTQQLKDAEEIRQRVRERLIDAKALPDSEVLRNIAPAISGTPMIGGPKFVSMPAPAAASVSNSPDDLQNTKAVDTTPSSATSLDLPLVDILSNLRSIIVGSGAKSRLVAAAHAAKKENERIAVAAKLFGSDIAPHWAPKNAADVIFDAGVTEPERMLRDATASDQQKRHALYALLATSSPTEQQQMWLSSVIEGLLK